MTDGADSGAAPHGLGWRIGWTLAGFAPYLAVSAVQLVTKFTKDSTLDAVTKGLEIPALAVGIGGVLLTTKRKPRTIVAALLFIGLALSWVGDVALNSSLPLGLGAFLAAHAVYVALFQVAFRDRRRSRWTVLAIPWFVGLLVLLGPYLGGMLPVVALYGLVLGLMAVWSTRGNPLTILGALLFVASDSILAFRLFTPMFPGDGWEFVVMLTYLGAQALIAVGVLRNDQERLSRSSGNPVSSSMVDSPSSANPQRS